MHALLTTLVATLGLGLTSWGFARALRHRFAVRDRVRSLRGRRSGVLLYAVGGLVLLLPDLIVSALLAAPPSDDPALAVLGTLGGLLWRAAVVLGMSVGALVLWLTSERVTTPVRAGIVAAIDRVPRRADFEHAALRRRAGLIDFPREWTALVEHDRALARRLLGQGNHFEAAVLGVGATIAVPSGHARSAVRQAPVEDLSALRDWHDPVTRRALEALVECDRVRTPVPPRGTRDVLGSDYGRAVAAFEAAVVAAEDNARRRAAG